MATELFAAIKAGDRVAVERLLERDRALADARDENGLSPILAALYRGETEIASAILRRGPRLTVFEAAAAGDAPRVREIVGKDRAQANAVAPDGYSALGLAAFFKRREIVTSLLEAGADPRIPSRQGGVTPPHPPGATDAGAAATPILPLLLHKRAGPHAQSHAGPPPLPTI